MMTDEAWQALLARAEQRRSGMASGSTLELADWHGLYADFASRPMIFGHLGQSIDGRIATTTGDSYYVTGEDNLVHLHRMRALADAVIVGIGTVVQDNPKLTVRRVEGPNSVRVLLDPEGIASQSSNIFSDGAAETLWLTRKTLPPYEGADGFARAAVEALKARGLASLFVEGGGRTVSRFLAAGLLDRLQITVAPVIVGAGRQGLSWPAVARMSDALRPPCRTVAMGKDVLFEFDLPRPPHENGAGQTAG
ncbi:MAG: RibD family protein [Pseudomonadota bacterium]